VRPPKTRAVSPSKTGAVSPPDITESEFRPLTRMDSEAVLALVQEIETAQGLGADFYWPQEALEGELWTAEGWGAFHQGKLRAFALYRFNPQAFEISVVATALYERKQGWMEKLLTKAVDALSQEREVWLEVHENNLAAQKLYEKLGFSRVGERPSYYRDLKKAYLYSFAHKVL
jgi:ribosomal-protein-alanine N-acetyltransferase